MGRVQLYICVTMGRNSSIFLLFLVLFGLSSVNGYKLIDDNLEEGEDQNWNQGIDYSPEDLVKYGSGFRSIWDTNPYLDLESRSKRVHGALRFHRPWNIEQAMLNNRVNHRLRRNSWFG